MANSPKLYKFNGEPLATHQRIGFKILNFIQDLLIKLAKIFQPYFVAPFNRRGIPLYIINRLPEGEYATSNQLFEKLKEIVKDTKEIKLALGEAGAGILEDPRVIDALMYAFKENHAIIEILHGPRVDLKTHTIFKLAEEGVVSLFRMPYYANYHFFLLTNKKNEITVISEGIHEETIWARTQDGESEVFASKTRLFYIVKQSKNLLANLINEFNQRKKRASQIYQHPGLVAFIEYPQSYSFFGLLPLSFLTFLCRSFLQPSAICHDLNIDPALIICNCINNFRYYLFKLKRMQIFENRPPLVLPENRELDFHSTAKSQFERSVERSVGESIDVIRTTPLNELHKMVKKRWQIAKLPPFVILFNDVYPRERLISDEELEKRFNKAIK